MFEALIISIVVLFLLFFFSSLPLYFAVKALGGKTTFLKTMVIMFITGIIVSVIKSVFDNGWLIAFLVLVVIYREVFRLKWWKAFLVWFVHLLFMVIFYALIAFFSAAIIGVSFLTLF